MKARFWHPKPDLQHGKKEYQLYFLPTKIGIVPGPFLKETILDTYKKLGGDIFKIKMTHPKEIEQLELCRIGHNFFGLFGERFSQ